MTDEDVAAVWIPAASTDTVARRVRSIGRTLGDLCLHEDTRTTGRWVCVLPAEHEGRHG